jgi:hypothetical protein
MPCRSSGRSAGRFRVSGRNALLTPAALAALLLAAAMAQPVPWVHPDGSIHYYDALRAPSGIAWNAAAESARARGGYLATVTSAPENDLLFGLCDSSGFWYVRPSGEMVGPWLGGFQPPGESGPGVNWRWVNGDSFGYANWAAGEPNNRSDSNVVGFGSSASPRTSYWSDLDKDDDSVRAAFIELSAGSTTVGLTRFDSGASDGYFLFAPMSGRHTYLVDSKGRLVHVWRSDSRLATAVYLLEDGRLLRVANAFNGRFPEGGRVELLDWDGTVAWAYDYSDSLVGQHHDAQALPDGHVLMLAYELKTRTETVAAGRDPARLLMGELHPEKIVEVDPATNGIVWEWRLWDHLVQDFDSSKAGYGDVAGHPELVDINYLGNGDPFGIDDWIHANSIDYNPDLDQVMLSSRSLSEVWVIDHGTTTEQARGHTGGRQGMGGDILYRWGNPQAYRAGDSADQRFFGQHDARWIGPGLPGARNIMVFNNGSSRPNGESYSSVDEIVPPCDSAGRYPRPEPGAPHGPASPCWSYGGSPRASFCSVILSSAQRLPDGRTFVCRGLGGLIDEVTADSQALWSYTSPVRDSIPVYQGDPPPVASLYNARYYARDYPGLAGRNLEPGYPLEHYRSPGAGVVEPTARGPVIGDRFSAAPNPFRAGTKIALANGSGLQARIGIVDAAGRIVRVLAPGQGRHGSVRWDGNDDSGRPVGRGIYWCRLLAGGRAAALKLVKLD